SPIQRGMDQDNNLQRHAAAGTALTTRRLTRRTDANAGGGSGPGFPPPGCIQASSRTPRNALYSRELERIPAFVSIDRITTHVVGFVRDCRTLSEARFLCREPK